MRTTAKIVGMGGLGALALLGELLAFANQFSANQRNILPGGRAALMGGAFTALSDDSSGAYYNPAGLAFSPGREVSISGLSYFNNNLVYRSAVDGQDFTEKSSGTTTTFIGGTLGISGLKVGWSIINLDVRNINQNDSYVIDNGTPASTGIYTRTHQESNTYAWYGASLALKLSNAMSVGVSGYHYKRVILASNHNMSAFESDDAQVIDKKFLTDNKGMVVVFGGMYRTKSWSLGFSARLPQALSNSTVVNVDELSYSPSQWDENIENVSASYQECFQKQVPCALHSDVTTSSLHELNPYTFTLGFAWTPGKAFTLSSDILFHQGVASPYTFAGNRDLEHTLNYSLGAELFLGGLTLRAGAFTNYSMYPEPTAGGVNQASAIDYVGFTGGVGVKDKGRDSFIGVVRQIGTGKSQILTNDPSVQEVVGDSIIYNIGATYVF